MIVQQLLEKGAPPNSTDSLEGFPGKIALYKVVIKLSEVAVLTMLEKRASPKL
jgi:hypothetical protein